MKQGLCKGQWKASPKVFSLNLRKARDLLWECPALCFNNSLVPSEVVIYQEQRVGPFLKIVELTVAIGYYAMPSRVVESLRIEPENAVSLQPL